jgi:hypothetical protein
MAADTVNIGTVGAASETSTLAGIRGWLLAFAIWIALGVPLSAVTLASFPSVAWGISFYPSAWGAEHLRLLFPAVIFVGHTIGLVLIGMRQRYAPAFFTLYLPLLALLLIVDPLRELVYLEWIGFEFAVHPDGLSEIKPLLIAKLLGRLAILGVATAYWLHSQRVKTVFGSKGLDVFRSKSAAC